MKKAIALVLTICMMLSLGVTAAYAAVGRFDPDDFDPELDLDFDFDWGDALYPLFANVALGKPVSINNDNSVESYAADGWSIEALTDGETANGWHSNIFGSGSSSRRNPTVLTIDLRAPYAIDCVQLYPYAGDDYAASIMPRNYFIEVFSVEENDWVRVASDSGVVAANGVHTGACYGRVEVLSYEFDPVVASQARLTIILDSGIDIGGTCDVTCIGEIAVFGTTSALNEHEGLSNVAQGKTVSVNNGNAYDEPALMWGPSYVTDGSIYSAWLNDPVEIVSSSHSPTVLTVNLSGSYEISSVELYPYGISFGESTMPRNYTVEVYSSDAREWVEVGRERGAVIEPGYEAEKVFSYEFEPVNATHVRVTVTVDSNCYMDTLAGVTAIGEIAVWGGPAGAGGNGTETVTETEAADESETVGNARDTTASDETSGQISVGIVGCASSIGVGAVSALMIAAAAVLIKRKKE